MTRDDLIGAFLAGDMGAVEFVELALDAGMGLDEIDQVLADAEDGL